MEGADVYIDPPGNGNVSDGDSGDEDFINFDQLSRNQLLAPAELTLRRSQDNDDDEEVLGVPLTSRSTVSSIKTARRKWVKRDLPQNGREWFSPLPRSVLAVDSGSDPLTFFELFFNHDVIMHIVKQSVIYAAQQGNMSFTLSDSDIYCFLGILILSGYSPVPRRRMYWENNEDTRNILVTKCMSRNRFEEILRYFHVADNTNLAPNDKMAKVRPLFDMLNKTFIQFAPIEKEISIDESMIPYYGRHGCKQHIRGKPIRFGFKTWIAALRLGYCLYADPYQGRSERIETGLGQYVVNKLVTVIQTEFPGTEFSIYCDNFFTGLPLITEMKEKGILLTGTVRNNRIEKCPLKDPKLCKKEERGYFDSRLDSKNGICAVRWHDNNIVTLLSSEYGVHPIQTANRYSVTQKQRVGIQQPNVVSQYNRFMGGVDRLDANISTYRIAIRGKKWYIPIIFYLIDVAVNNATLLARFYSKDTDTLEFRRSIARSLMLKYADKKKRPGPSRRILSEVPPSVRRHNSDHMICKAPSRLRCALCKNKTVTACQKCGVNIHSKCFQEFHT